MFKNVQCLACTTRFDVSWSYSLLGCLLSPHVLIDVQPILGVWVSPAAYKGFCTTIAGSFGCSSSKNAKRLQSTMSSRGGSKCARCHTVIIINIIIVIIIVIINTIIIIFKHSKASFLGLSMQDLPHGFQVSWPSRRSRKIQPGYSWFSPWKLPWNAVDPPHD